MEESSRALISGTVADLCSELEKNNEKAQGKKCLASGSKCGPPAKKKNAAEANLSVYQTKGWTK